jgi:hypothetical protein
MNWRGIGAIVLGVVAIAVGVYMQFFSGTDVMCGTDVMQPGDLCEETRRGTTTTYTFDEMKQNASMSSWYAMGFGVVAIGFGAFTLWRGKKKAAAAAAPAA